MTTANKNLNSTNRLFQIHNQQIWFIPQRIDLRPEKRNAPSNLHKTKFRCIGVHTQLSTWLRKEENLFRLIEVGYVAFVVDATAEKASASPETASTAYECQLHVSPVEKRGFHVECCGVICLARSL